MAARAAVGVFVFVLPLDRRDSPVAKTLTVKADTTGRLTLPPSLCKALGIEPGDTFVVAAEEQGILLRPTQRENPFDALTAHALAKYRAGRTQNLRDFAAEHGIDLDG
jgi:bifunctional DNA-binding transcriptional regulator/antitoxin component of YhaV-PrlF toxin-antitoxin module